MRWRSFLAAMVLLFIFGHALSRPVAEPRATGPAPVTTRAQAEPPPFTFVARELSPAIRKRIMGVSWRPGCPVGLSGLRHLRIAHHGSFDGRVHNGEMIVNRSAVRALERVFASLYRSRSPIRRMRLVDDYGGSDYRSIEADNTSAFNCRRVTGGSRWSQHSYGRALDINPIESLRAEQAHLALRVAALPRPVATPARNGVCRRPARARLRPRRVGLGWQAVEPEGLPALLGERPLSLSARAEGSDAEPSGALSAACVTGALRAGAPGTGPLSP